MANGITVTMASSLKQRIATGSLALLTLVIAVSILPALAAGGGGGSSSLRRQNQPATQPPGIGAAAAPARRRRKLEDEGYAEEWAEQYYEEEAAEADAAETDGDTAVWFDDDKYKEYEVATKKNFWSMFNNPPASWTARQWGFFAGVLTVFSIVFCCILKVFCPFG